MAFWFYKFHVVLVVVVAAGGKGIQWRNTVEKDHGTLAAQPGRAFLR